MATIQLPNGAKVTKFIPPPVGFDPLRADDTTLIRHGFPLRPADPQALKRWTAAVSQPMNYIDPDFLLMPHMVHGPRRRGETAGTETSTNWSGAVVYAPAGSTFKWVEGNWNVPDPFPAAADGTWYYSASWIGIDGDGSQDVCQAGVECEAVTAGGVTTKNVYAWWEWYPNGEVKISNFPVSAGDMLSCVICVTSATTATVYLVNNSSGGSTSFQITAPSGTTLQGNCAEWVVEAPTVGGSLANLARYGEVYFDNAIAETSANVLVKGGTGNTISMTGGGKTISTPTIETPTLIKCLYTC
jgi:hypothetical protein